MQRIKDLFLNDFVILAVIVLNAAAIFVSGYPLSEELKEWIERIDVLCTFIFTIEAAVKINTYSVKTYFKSGWNIFDFMLVAFSIPQVFLWLFGGNVDGLGVVLILRLFRIFRIFRLIKFIPDIHKIIDGAQRAVKASSLIIIVFLIFNFIIGIISFNIFNEMAPEQFSDPLISIYSIFKIFTVEGWYEIPDAIAANTSPFLGMVVRFYFINLLFIGGIFGLSLVNSIFVDNMVSDNNDELEAKIDALESKIDTLTELIKKRS